MDDSKAITTEKVKHIAHLARIGLSDEEVQKFCKQLEPIMDYMKILEEVITDDDIPETTQVTGQKNIMRDDNNLSIVKPDELLDCSTLPKVNHQISVKAVIKD